MRKTFEIDMERCCWCAQNIEDELQRHCHGKVKVRELPQEQQWCECEKPQIPYCNCGKPIKPQEIEPLDYLELCEKEKNSDYVGEQGVNSRSFNISL